MTETFTDNLVSGGSSLVQETLQQPVSGGEDASIEDQLEAVQLSIAVATTTPILPSVVENINAPTGMSLMLQPVYMILIFFSGHQPKTFFIVALVGFFIHTNYSNTLKYFIRKKYRS
jgi:hypothetical protein